MIEVYQQETNLLSKIELLHSISTCFWQSSVQSNRDIERQRHEDQDDAATLTLTCLYTTPF